MENRGEKRRCMSFAELLGQRQNVMSAVILRDMRSRFFNHGLGFIVQSLWPLAHMVVIIFINAYAGRAAPYGESPLIFFGVGVIPTLTFLYISRFMSLSVLMNRNMLSFPVVRVVDILFGRALLEIMAGCITLVFLWVVFTALGLNPYPADPAQAVLAYLATILLAVGIGTIAGVITSFIPFFATAYALMSIIFYMSSGCLFVTVDLPDQAAIPLSYNPVVQCVEWMRTAYFENYSDRLVDKEYLLGFGIASLFVGLVAERCSRRILMDS
ncbi:capsular biosynthesis protein [Rhizobium sp. NXC24]|uniref:ABC transporter permease n=1 Tax=Rhizobium sp. NXC24 TaxID=2048897 RepID=UPI000CDF4F41|nr:capsular biosynthesis protein [Rhizobium sp. NXC24]AVA25745.1 ABC-2 type transporter permease protein [Rhizobium sp. NXC24]